MRAAAVATALVVLATGACSTSSSPAQASPCSSNPIACGRGSTCWPADTKLDLECLPSQQGAGMGASCQEMLGVATCGDGMLCDARGAEGGTCTPYCDLMHPCPQGFSCRQTQVGMTGPMVDICRAGTSGDDGGGPGPDASGDDSGIIIPDGSAGDGPSMM